MRRALALAVVFVCVVGSALEARAHGMHGFRHGGFGHRGAVLPDSLTLTDAQQSQLSALRDSMAQQEMTLRQGYRDSLLAVLTAEQRAALDSVRAGCRGGYRTPVSLDLADDTLGTAADPATATQATSWGEVKGATPR